jgi:hypothetical protein
MPDTHTIADHVKTIESSEDRAQVLLSALALARSDDPAALDALGDLLSRADVLARLDDLDQPQAKMSNLGRVMALLAEKPSPETAALCLRLAQAEALIADDDRQRFLLEGLAAFRPVSEDAAGYFRWTNPQGYFSINARLLAENGSPVALAVFEEMIRDTSVPAERRIDALHSSVMTHRTTPAVLQMVDRLLAAALEPSVRIGVIESVFDWQGKAWFGPHALLPPPFRCASGEVLKSLLTLGEKILKAGGFEARLEDVIKEDLRIILALLSRRSV